MQSINGYVSPAYKALQSSLPISSQILIASEGNEHFSPEQVNSAVQNAQQQVNAVVDSKAQQQASARGFLADNYANNSAMNQLEVYLSSVSDESVSIDSGISNQALLESVDEFDRQRPNFGFENLPQRPDVEPGPLPEEPSVLPVSQQQAALSALYQSASQPIASANLEIMV